MSEFKSLLVDAKANLKRAMAMKDFQAKNDLQNNVWPFMIALVEACANQEADVEEAFDELLEDEGSTIQPDVAAQIFATLEVGKLLCEALKALELNDLQKKSIGDLVETYLKAAAATEVVVGEAAVELEDPEEETEDEDEDDEEEDDADDEEVTPAVAAVPALAPVSKDVR